MGFPGGASGKEPACQCRRLRDLGSIPELGRSPGERHSNPIPYSCLENPMDRGAWWAMLVLYSKFLFVIYFIYGCCCSVAKLCLTRWTPWTAACQASLPITISLSFLKLMSIEAVMSSNHLILCCPPSPQFFPASGPFPMSQLFTSGGQSIRASASVLPMNIQCWFPLGLTGWLSLQSKRLSRVFSSPTVPKHQFLSAQPSL